jgi:hypothetical protein
VLAVLKTAGIEAFACLRSFSALIGATFYQPKEKKPKNWVFFLLVSDK